MASYLFIVLDGTEYKVRVRADNPLAESFRVEDGPNTMTTLDGTELRDVLGTYYDHSLYVEVDPAHPEDYDAFYEAISAPVASHLVQLPHSQGELQYQAKITKGSRNLRGTLGGRRRWYGLQVGFETIKPQREP